jgi:H+/Na+-translocating ferredoxin:NAD+ oxidoreductase subunit B
MESVEQAYRDLRHHLDKQPIGFPASKSGAELRILKRIFTPDQARLATHLSYKLSTAEQVCQSAGASDLSRTEVETMLDDMAAAGAIACVGKEGQKYFHLQPLVVGMFESQLGSLDAALVADIDAYTNDRSFGLSFLSTEVPQMRTIPVEKSLSVDHAVTSYDALAEVINDSEGPFGVGQCICRKAAEIKGKPCEMTNRLETCMAVGDMARQAIETGDFREVSRKEALDIARLNQADGLVLQPSNTQKIEFVCACCGCCCGMLAVLKSLPKPLDFWATNYYATVDAEVCDGCATCVERCQMEAVIVGNGSEAAHINLDRCIGCGNCVATCSTGAMSLVKKSQEVVPPLDLQDQYEIIMAHKKGAIGKARLATRLMLNR